MNDITKETIKKQLLERLLKNFTIASACNSVGVDRKTFYRWTEEDPEFKITAYENILECKKTVTDMANTKLVKHIENGNLTAVMYWLNNRDPEIIDKKSINITEEEIDQLSSLLYNPTTFKKGQELLTSYVLREKVSEKHAQLILRLFLSQMKVDTELTRKKEAEILSEVTLREKKKW